MNQIVASRITGGNSEYGRVSSDFYPTPPEVTQALLNFFGIDYVEQKVKDKTLIWEPACGEGHMIDVFKKNGLPCTGTDIKTGTDFLTAPLIPCKWIITNPPFSQSEQFIRRCLEHKKPFALLLKSQYWHAKKRLDLFREHMPTYVLPLTWRPDFLFDDQKRGHGSPLMDVMWVVWGKDPAEQTAFYPLDKPQRKEIKES